MNMKATVVPICPEGGTGRVNPLNPLSKPIRRHISKCLKRAIEDPAVTSIILYGGKNFSAGADISEFSAKNNDPKAAIESSSKIPSITDLCNQIEASPKPVIAAISGVALGGGLELALACHFRIGHAKARIALPEVNIGLIPGAGGTQRLPRVCHGGNVAWALNTILTGRMVGMDEAKKVGVIDEIITNDSSLLDQAKKWASYAELMGNLKFRTTCQKNVFAEDDADGKFAASKICEQIAKKIPRVDRGGMAAHAAVAAVRASFETKTFDEGMEVESELFWELLLQSKQGQGLRHAFFAERAAQKVVGGDQNAINDIVAQSLLKGQAYVGVIGAGTMGSGIAISFLRAGYKVILVDNNAKGLERGSKLIAGVFKQDVKKNRISALKAEHIISHNFQTTVDMSSSPEFAQCLLVIEAVFENLKIKQSIFKQLNQTVKNPKALLLSNTSTLNIDSIASALPSSRRKYCAGMHFFSPAHVMKLVEIVVSSSTSRETTALIQLVTSKKLRKVGVVVGNCEGFVGNRMLFPYTGESVFVLQEGRASVPEVDKAIVSFGMALGPMNMGDLAGNDIGYLVRKEKGLVKDPTTGLPGPNRKPGMRYTDLGDDLVAKLGRVGQKKLKGWYDYDPNVGRGRKPIPSQQVANFIASYSQDENQKKYNHQEIVERVLFPLVNEGFKILEEGIARQPSDIDTIYIYGYGWPSWRGGPMFWADNEVGLSYLLKRLEEMNEMFPGTTYYQPSKLLRRCVALKMRVDDYYNEGLHKQNSKL